MFKRYEDRDIIPISRSYYGRNGYLNLSRSNEYKHQPKHLAKSVREGQCDEICLTFEMKNKLCM